MTNMWDDEEEENDDSDGCEEHEPSSIMLRISVILYKAFLVSIAILVWFFVTFVATTLQPENVWIGFVCALGAMVTVAYIIVSP